MFNIGGGELIVIMLIALIVLGPQRLPDAARQIGKVMGDLRRLSTGFQNEMRSALDTADDPNRIAARRNVLAKETPAVIPEEPAADTAPPAPARAAAKKAAAKKTPAPRKAPLKATTVKNGAPVKKAPAKKVPAAKKSATKGVSKAAPRRTKG